jgi:tRNA(Arg) A34 adenosine deaminase TadA
MASGEDKQALYGNINAGPDDWIKLACTVATESVCSGCGPFGAVMVQIDDETGKVIRHWEDHNRVAEYNDPTAHAEISIIRQVCKELGVFHLNAIPMEISNLMQPGNFSHCELYSSCEPCPMCYAAIRWAQITALTFAATRFDADEYGFSDLAIYKELEQSYESRELKVRHTGFPAALEAFTRWKNSQNPRY